MSEIASSNAAGGGRTWRFGQCFGEKDADEEFSEADVLSAVRFDDSGDFLATGDKGGRVVIFERAEGGRGSKSDSEHNGTSSSAAAPPQQQGSEYKFYTEFQSHEAEFDYLKSLEIEEKINQIAWCKRSSAALFLLSTNDKTIKLWKIHEKRLKSVASMNVEMGRYGGPVPVNSLRMPTLSGGEAQIVATPRRVYGNAHAYHINSIAVNSDGQTFLSADDLRVNLWSLENAKLSFNIVDIKPPTLEELTEVITAADFHPTECNVFMYASSRGSVRLADMRAAALCDKHTKIFEEVEDPSAKSYFSEIIASVSDIEFSRDGRYILSRDYLAIKIWDITMESRPVKVIPVHEYLRPKLVELYESDCIFDKFEVCCSGDGSSLMTGSYNNSFKIFDVAKQTETTIELSKSRPKPPVTRPIHGTPLAPGGGVGGGFSGVNGSHGGDVTMSGTGADGFGSAPPIEVDDIDFSKKVLHYTWHPQEDIVAVASANNLWLFSRDA